MKKLIFALSGALLTFTIGATNIIVPGRATSVVKDGTTVTINCDGFWQEEVCFQMTTTEFGATVLMDDENNTIYSGIVVSEEVIRNGDESEFQFIFEE